jgi:hypothetical protein
LIRDPVGIDRLHILDHSSVTDQKCGNYADGVTTQRATGRDISLDADRTDGIGDPEAQYHR